MKKSFGDTLKLLYIKVESTQFRNRNPLLISYQVRKILCLFIAFISTTLELSCQKSNYDIEQIHFETTPCEGTCPVFKMVIGKDRIAFYDAMYYNERTGRYKTTIPLKDYNWLLEILNSSNFPNFKNRYTSKWTDLPSCRLTVKHNKGKVKSIYDYGQRGTEELRKIYKVLFDLRKTQNWTKL